MAIFNFIRDGQKFAVNAPPGVSEAQARSIFEKQFATGSLTNLPVGGELNASIQAAAGLTSALPFAKTAQSLTPQLTGVPMQSAMSTANFLKQPLVTESVGNLNSSQLQGMLAQLKKSTNQPATTVSATTGIGSYGISPQALEQNGYLKPGTVKNYLSNPNQLESVLKSPTVWTGKGGATNLTSFVSNPNIQNNVQTQVLNSSFNSLLQNGTVTSGTSAATLAPLLQISQKLGPGVADAWAKGSAPASVIGQANDLAKQGQYALNFVNTKLPVGATGEVAARGFNNTVNRSSVDQAVKQIINNNKIPSPSYNTGSFDAVKNLGSGALSRLTSLLG